MKKTDVVSCCFQLNYGSMLKAYATQQGNIPDKTICIDGLADEIKKFSGNFSRKLKYKVVLKKEKTLIV